MDANGYPDDHELARIQAWPREDYRGLMEFVRSLWRFKERDWTQGLEDRYQLVAGAATKASSVHCN